MALSSGPRSARIVILGEFPSEDDIRLGAPFSGHSGTLLTELLSAAGLNRDGCFITQLFSARPPGGDISKWTVKRAALPSNYALPAIGRGEYLDPSRASEVTDCLDLLLSLQPNIIITLGTVALWALTGSTGIASHRGAIIERELAPGRWVKILPTFSPASLFKAWHQRPVLIKDLAKAKRESASSAYVRPARSLLICPTPKEFSDYAEAHLLQAPIIATDIETARRQITAVSFAPSARSAVVVPLHDPDSPDGSYYSREDELAIWRTIRTILSCPARKLMQNGTYDTQYFLAAGLPVRNFSADTLVLHHALYPELQKGLGFLGSIYTDEPSWKFMRKAETSKRDE